MGQRVFKTHMNRNLMEQNSEWEQSRLELAATCHAVFPFPLTYLFLIIRFYLR